MHILSRSLVIGRESKEAALNSARCGDRNGSEEREGTEGTWGAGAQLDDLPVLFCLTPAISFLLPPLPLL